MEELNLVEILKDCPKGIKLYSTVFGIVEFLGINDSDDYPIVIRPLYNEGNVFTEDLRSDGQLYIGFNGECILFPSKENRDWSTFKVQKPKFDVNSLQPFDKVLVRDGMDDDWQADLFSHREDNYKSIHVSLVEKRFFCIGSHWGQCIPYNDDTKHLIGTTNKAPDFYVTWDKE